VRAGGSTNARQPLADCERSAAEGAADVDAVTRAGTGALERLSANRTDERHVCEEDRAPAQVAADDRRAGLARRVGDSLHDVEQRSFRMIGWCSEAHQTPE